MKNGIEPTSDKAPQNIRDAVKKFFGIYDGKLTNLNAPERTKLAENIGLVATGQKGKKGNVCYSIFDFGEGQTPKMFPNTFLSIGKSNKLKIPFVQGKFNMGGTGALRFCGNKKLQLIVSKKNPNIPAKFCNDETRDMWGFTIVKRVPPPSKGIRSSKFVYLAPNDEVLSFNADSLKILPGKYPNPYEKEMPYGTFIKLYDYQISSLKTVLTLNLYYRLSLLMPSLALPIRLYERRKGYKAHTLDTTLNGLSVRLEEDKRSNLESEEWPSTHDMSILGEAMKVSIYAFKRNLEDSRRPTERYVKDEGIIFTINGQTHGSIHKRFFSRRNVGLGNLSDSLIVMVNCSDISGQTREDLFMNSRDRLVESGHLRDQIENELEDILKNHQGLKELKHRRHKEDIENKLDDSKPLSEVLEKIMKKSPVLAKLFISGQKLSNPVDIENKKAKEEFVGEKFPTFFKLIKDYDIDNPRLIPKNNKRIRIQFKTDAVNDYFERETDKGIHKLQMDGLPFLFSKSMNLWNGIATLNIGIPDYLEVGTVLKFTSEVDDNNRIEPFVEEFYIKITEECKKKKSRSGKRKNPPSDEEGGDSNDKSGLSLPEIIKIGKEDWPSHGFDNKSALKVEFNGEELGWTFYVNIHNIHLLHEIKMSNSDKNLIEAQYVYALVLLGLSIINISEEHPNEENNGSNEKTKIDTQEFVKVFSRSVSPVIIPMISTLGELEENDVVFEMV
jgi:hypothetical protein